MVGLGKKTTMVTLPEVTQRRLKALDQTFKGDHVALRQVPNIPSNVNQRQIKLQARKLKEETGQRAKSAQAVFLLTA